MDEWEKKKIEIGKWVPLIIEDIGVDVIRDMYGFTIRPQHLQRYREYAAIYKEEEEERSERWKHFLETYVDTAQEPPLELPSNEQQDKGVRKVQTWSQIRHSLSAIERSLSFHKSRITSLAAQNATNNAINDPLPLKFNNPTRSNVDAPEEDSEEEFYDVERSDSVQDVFSNDSSNGASAASSFSPGRESCTWIEELECLVQGGVPMALRGELWQAFVGTNTRRVEGHYIALLAEGGDYEGSDGLSSNAKNSSLSKASIVEKWTSQIEKDLPRTFPGHPALDEDGRNALRRLLTAYAHHNPSVGYCQAMNFFAGLLLLLMPEENAFWTLTSIIEDYFDGYYSEDMVEAQVDQLVFEELVQGFFPKLAAHLDNLGVQVALVTGPWFLSIFVNVLPWESVLRVWDVLLYERNQTMLFRTALALMDLHGPLLLTTKDAGDAVASLQSLASATFDSSQLVLIACTGYQAVDDTRLHELRVKHRPQVLAAIHERSIELHMQRNSRDATSKLYSYDAKEEATTVKGNILEFTKQSHEAGTDDNVLSNYETGMDSNCLQSGSLKQKDANDLTNGVVDIGTENSIEDLQEQVKWLKIELCHALEEKKAATDRAEELETALVEIVKEDNRRLLSAKVEQLEFELANSKRAIVHKKEHEQAMLQVMMQLEQEQRRAEDARRLAEQDALAQRHAANVLQEKYEEAVNLLATMEKRAVMAESTLEATLQSQTNQVTSLKILPDSLSVGEEPSNVALSRTSSQRTMDAYSLTRNMEIPQELPVRRKSLLSRPFSFGWRDGNKGKSGSADVDALLSPRQHNSGRKRETAFTEHANLQLLHKDTDDVSETRHSEKVAL